MKTSRKLRSLLALGTTSALFLAVVGTMATSVAAQAAPVTNDGTCVVYGTNTVAAGGDTQDAANPSASATEQAGGTAEAETADQANSAVETLEAHLTQDPSYTGSVPVDQATMAALTGTARCDALSKLATVTVDQAKAAGEKTGGVVSSIELDEENGFLVYSVQLQDGTDVKVDAGTGSILNTQPAGSDNGTNSGAHDGENEAH